jgi:ATP-dependent DNA helicase RecQ
LADEKGVPPFVIFSDVSLRQMALERPLDLDAFSGIYGVGAEKLKRFGPIFVEAIGASR